MIYPTSDTSYSCTPYQSAEHLDGCGQCNQESSSGEVYPRIYIKTYSEHMMGPYEVPHDAYRQHSIYHTQGIVC